MKSNGSSNKMQTAGSVLSWLVGYAVVAMLILFVAISRNNLIAGNQRHGWLEQFVDSAGPVLGLSILVAVAVAAVICLVGIVRWPAEVIRSPLWVGSAIGIVLITAAASWMALSSPCSIHEEAAASEDSSASPLRRLPNFDPYGQKFGTAADEEPLRSLSIFHRLGRCLACPKQCSFFYFSEAVTDFELARCFQ